MDKLTEKFFAEDGTLASRLNSSNPTEIWIESTRELKKKIITCYAQLNYIQITYEATIACKELQTETIIFYPVYSYTIKYLWISVWGKK